MARVCFSFGGKNSFAAAPAAEVIELQQHGFDKFTVVYGAQVKNNLTYAQAAKELGECIMHFRAGDGFLDNRTRAEAKADGDKTPHYPAEHA